MESRVAVLEEIARTTSAMLARMDHRMDLMSAEFRSGFDGLRAEFRSGLDGLGAEVRSGLDGQRRTTDNLRMALDQLSIEHRTDFRWLLVIMLAGFAGLLGVMAHGFHWL